MLVKLARWAVFTGILASYAMVSAAELPADIPVGPADENEETSKAITLILENCADAYMATDAMHASGTFVLASKSEETTTYTSSQITLDYLRPDRFAVISKSESKGLDGAFYANGTTVTHVSTINKEYAKLPQPELSAYAENWRAGDIFREFSGILSLSGTGSLLISSNPLQWIHEGVVRYVYEGEEDNAGRSCYRIRFNQENPDSIVILWVDKETWLISKVSFISSYNDDFDMVETFDEGTIASMRVMTWDSISTSSADVNRKAFNGDVPRRYKPVEQEADWTKEFTQDKSFWSSIVQLAAESSSEETTWSLIRETGTVDLRLEKFVTTKEAVEDINATSHAAGQETPLAFGFKDGRVEVYNYDGHLSASLKLQDSLSMLGVLETKTSGAQLLVTGKDNLSLSAYNMTGEHLWSYGHPYTRITSFETHKDKVFVSLDGSGMRRLNAEGKVEYGNAKFRYAYDSPEVTEDGTGRMVFKSSLGITLTDSDLRILDSFDDTDSIVAVRWDEENKEAPLVSLAITDDRDVLLQGLSITGDVIWTTMIEPKSKEFPSANFVWARVRVGDVIEKCAVVMLTSGKVIITSRDGKILYRGQVSANDALVAQNLDNIINFVLPADANGDGVDELYFPIHTHMLRLKTEL